MNNGVEKKIKVQVGKTWMSIGKDQAGHEAQDGDAYKNLITQWAKAIQVLEKDGDAAGIPIDSEFVEIATWVLCLLAIKQGNRTIIWAAHFHDDWFEWENASIFMSHYDQNSQRQLTEGYFATSGTFGEYNTQALVNGLLDAELV